MRPRGSSNTLIKIDYDVIGQLAGVAGNTARAYSRRGLFDARDLESVLSWVNSRRQRQGLPLVGMPDAEVVSETANDTPLGSSLTDDPWSQFLRGLPVYIPTLGQYRSIYDYDM